MKALVLGRGASLVSYKNFFNEKFEYLYLVNEFNKFIVQDENLLLFLNKKKREGTKIIQQLNIEMAGLDLNFIHKVDIDEVYCTRLAFTNEKVWWRDYFDQNRFVKTMNIVVKPQPEVLESYMHMVGNSLPCAFLNAILVKNVKEITVLGCDFYESFYYLDHEGSWSISQWSDENTIETQNRLKSEFTNMVEKFQNISFNLITYSSYKNNSSNCSIHHLKI